MKPKFNATDYIRVDSRTMHGQEKFGEAVSAGQLCSDYQIIISKGKSFVI